MTSVSNNKYFCYWLLATNDSNFPIILVPGQVEGGTLKEADELNTLAGMLFGNIHFAEFVVLSRVMMLATISSYSIVQIDDYRTSNVASSSIVSESAPIVMDVLPDITTRDALENPSTGKQVHIIDASGDSNVYSS
ncbi:MAG: hypothetical protein KQ78_01877 [Candidatus Izimaplasma bacterium HR2]|nr:MAG: hypothetical protein KQ78_01877 [Candidatus Izimaplasma bacterium HR2]